MTKPMRSSKNEKHAPKYLQ